MALHERISDLIGRIYETADDPVGWPDVCADILKELGGRHMLVTLTDTKNLQCSKVQYFGAGDDLALIGSEEFAGGMCAGDPVLAYAEAHPQALCVDSRRLTASGQFLSWYYDRFKSDHYLVGYTPEIRGMTFGTSIHVQENRPVADERLFRMLFGHMVRAAHLAMTGNRDNQEKVARIELDELGRVIRSNGVASELLDQGIALHLDGRRLRAKNSDDDGNLQRALNNALGAQFDGGGSAVVRIRNQDGKHAFYVKATPQPSRATIAGMFKARATVEIIPFTSPEESGWLLPSFEELSSREAEVGELLVRGHSLESLAATLEISVNTAKIHLRGLFDKTGTNRQSDLIRTLLRLAGNA